MSLPPRETSASTSWADEPKPPLKRLRVYPAAFDTSASGPVRPLEPKLINRGVSVRWFLNFYETRIAPMALGPRNSRAVCEQIIWPDTAEHKCAYCQLPGVETGQAQAYLSFTWHQPFDDAVACIRNRFLGAEETIIGVDLFAFNYHVQDAEGQTGKLQELIRDEHLERLLVVVDQHGKWAARAWLLLEYYTAVTAGSGSDQHGLGKLELLPHLLDTRDAEKLSDMLFSIDVNKAEAQDPRDKQRILAEIDSRIGLVSFNSTLKRALALTIQRMPLSFEGVERRAMTVTAAQVLQDAGRYWEAESLFRNALQLAKEEDRAEEEGAETAIALHADVPGAMGRVSVRQALIMEGLASTLQDQGNLKEAEQLYRSALDSLLRAHGKDHADTARAMQGLAGVLYGLGRYSTAESLSTLALDVYKAQRGAEHPDVARAMQGLGDLLMANICGSDRGLSGGTTVTEMPESALPACDSPAPLSPRYGSPLRRTMSLPCYSSRFGTVDNPPGLILNKKEGSPLCLSTSMRGIEVQWLMDFYSERVACLNPEMTTEQVVETIIKPDTAAQGCSYVEVPGVICAAPQHFVSHAWSRPFHELVECLRRRFASNMSTIVWIDLFAFNQHADFDTMAENLKTLESTVRNTSSTLAILDSAGTCFTRIWCLLEQYTAVTADGAYDGGTGKLEILAYLLDSVGGAVSKVLSSIDCRQAGARYIADRDRILGQINDAYGAEKFNATLRTALAAAVAEPLYSRAIEIYRCSLGFGHPRTARVQHQLAELCIARQQFDKAEKLLHIVLEARRMKLGDYHPDTCKVLMRLGQLQHHLGELAKAAVNYEAARAGYHEALGPVHRRTAAAAEGLATVLFTTALTNASASPYKQHACINSTDTGQGAGTCEDAGRRAGLLDRAAELLLYSLDVYRQRYGEGHHATSRTHDLLDQCLLSRLGVDVF